MLTLYNMVRKQGRDEIGDEGIGGHFFQTAPQFGCHHSRRGCAWPDDAHQYGFHHDEGVAPEIETDDDSQLRSDEDHLLYAYPEMPLYRQQFPEIDLAESDKEYEKHEVGQHICIVGRIPLAYRAESRDEPEKQIDNAPRAHSHGERPVFDEADECVHV